jgi:peroxiredoxin
MIELGELEAHHAEFARRNVQMVVVSVDSREESAKTQDRFPHLIVVSDADRQMINHIQLVHAHAGPARSDIATPTTFLVDKEGTVRWLFRPDRIIVRLSAADLLAAVDAHF